MIHLMHNVHAVCRPHLRRTIRLTCVIGTVLFVINQLDVVLAGRATTATWLKTALTYVVPFVVANYGVLVGSRGNAPRPRSGSEDERRSSAGIG